MLVESIIIENIGDIELGQYSNVILATEFYHQALENGYYIEGHVVEYDGGIMGDVVITFSPWDDTTYIVSMNIFDDCANIHVEVE